MLDRLRSILLKEQQRGYDDRTVMGGLEALVRTWHSKIGSQDSSTDDAQRLLNVLERLEPYSKADSAGRAELVRVALASLATADGPVRRPSSAPSTGVQPKRPTQSRSQTPAARDRVSEPERATRPMSRRDVSPARSAVVPRPAARRSASPVSVDSDVRNIWGISDVYATRLRRLGVSTIRDLLYHFPRKHVDYSVVKKIRDLTVGEIETIQGTIWEVRNAQARSGMTVTTAVVADETGTAQAIWFNQAFLAKALQTGQKVILSGRVQENLGRLQFKSPDWEVPRQGETVHTGRLVPMYPLTEGLTDRWVRSVVKRAIDQWCDALEDHVPRSVRDKMGLVPLREAVAQMHFPDDAESLARASRRLAFDEFFVLQLAVLTRRRDWRKEPGNAMRADASVIEGFIRSLPFTLTNAQRRVIDEVVKDMAQALPMSRLLQGEVGSGKTVVAATAAVVAAHNGFQAVLMAPTEILAEQHYRTVSELVGANGLASEQDGAALSRELPGFDGRRLRLGLLTGSVRKSRKEALCREIADGQVDIVVGTHALLEEGVQFYRLGLVIVDEQHRFGVMQRATLRQKGYNPDLLVMTATPIPRTLALTMYGDLDLSVLDELPPGRQEIKTVWLGPNDRERAYSFLREQARRGRQGFIICPLVEESDKIEAKAAVAEHDRLQREVFPDLRLGLLHGRMRGADKERVMRAFRNGEFDVLVSTAVVEVGIDVPNATVMLIEGADRFGLAQLHQFRGRVGRGQEKSYCLLLAESPSFLAEQRLMAISHVQDGFELAEEDLRLRGPGEFFGTRQSGLPDLKVAQFSDLNTLQEARAVAEELFQVNPFLDGAEYRLLREKVEAFLSECADLN